MQPDILQRDSGNNFRTTALHTAVTAFWYAWAMYIYYTMCFYPVSGTTYRISVMIMLFAFSVMATVDAFVILPMNLEGIHIFFLRGVCMTDAAGIYTMLAYRVYMPGHVKASAVIFIVLSLPYLILVIHTIYSLRRNRTKELGVNFRVVSCKKILIVILVLAALASLFTLVPVAYKTITGQPMYLPDVKAASASEQYRLSDYTEKIAAAGTDDWRTLSTKEKLDVLQTVANLERTSLGINHELNVGSEYMENAERTVANYSVVRHEIVINQKFLESEADGYKMIGTVCHEAYHAYSYQLIELYEKVSDDDRRLMCFRKTEQYIKEFSEYKDAYSYGYDAYAAQRVESDANEHAASSLLVYTRAIQEYLEGGDEL